MVDVGKVDSVAIDDIGKINLMDVPAGALAEDILNSGIEGDTATATTTWGHGWEAIAAGVDKDIATCTTAFDASSIAVGSGFIHAESSAASTMKLRLYMDALQAAESGWLSGGGTMTNIVVKGTRALSGNKIVKCAIHNYSGSSDDLIRTGRATGQLSGAVAVGSIKLV